jgi:large subunit ribosomal protein L17
MRHGKKFNHLGRKKGHREALLRNHSISLIEHKRIFTTLAKGKALRKFVEPVITKAKPNTTHAHRVVFSYLQNKEAIKELFDAIITKVGDRPGGYVRVIRTGTRPGDNAEMCMVELVDFNETALNATESDDAGKKKTRRSRRKKSSDATSTEVPEIATDAAEDTADENKED